MSGYLFFLGFHWQFETYRRKLRTRCRTLLVPLLVWGLLSLVLFAIAQSLPATAGFFSGNSKPIAAYGAYDYANAIFGFDQWPLAYQFWFIRDLIVLVLLVPLVYWVLSYVPNLCTFLFLAIWLANVQFWYIPSAQAIAFFVLGAHCGLASQSLFALDRCGMAVALIYVPLLVIDASTKTQVWNPQVHRIGVLAGMIVALWATKFVLRSNQLKRFLHWASGCSFFVFAVHEPLLTLVRKLAYRALKPSSDALTLGLFFAIPLVVIALALVVCILLNRVMPRLMNVVTGGRN